MKPMLSLYFLLRCLPSAKFAKHIASVIVHTLL
jgi:hypothetical protein